ncbi:MAG: hypothetical protein DHS20C01_36700 [marine bacterium B5-7]|nr:MAG: hypothetical protein DHS20C01_36700 [marine bacterium B5-7]
MSKTNSELPSDAGGVIHYWIGNADTDPQSVSEKGAMWFGSSSSVDNTIKTRFGSLVDRALSGGCDDWTVSANGTLALIILVDQFTRNIFRGTADAFSGDSRALELCLEHDDNGTFESFGPMSRVFALMPLQHAENLDIQQRSIKRFEALVESCDDSFRKVLESNAKFARLHHDIIARFGRFPHRNRVLGRTSNAAETAWLADDAPTFGQGG